jgi:hypothetical protein
MVISPVPCCMKLDGTKNRSELYAVEKNILSLQGKFPQPVATLKENFLVFRNMQQLRSVTNEVIKYSPKSCAMLSPT